MKLQLTPHPLTLQDQPTPHQPVLHSQAMKLKHTLNLPTPPSQVTPHWPTL